MLGARKESERMDWTAGYVTELEYTYGYYRELCPGILRLACLSAGVAPPVGKPLRYLELGYGQGLSLNIHAAAVPGEFWGTDFNPTQVAQARALAEASGSGAKLLDDSFAEFASRPDLPEFDVIGLHGIWTWISEANSRIIVDLIRRKLRVGGIVYISYNCLPGWAPSMPLRHLVKLHADLAAEATGMLGKLDGALAFARQVIDSGALYFHGNPAVGERLKLMSGQNRNYLAHEYFNEDWRIMAFSEVAKCLDDAKLSFVTSAHLLDHVEAVNLTSEGNKLLAEIKHPILRQSVRDYFVNQQFRRDVFIKGPRRVSRLEQQEALQSASFALTTHADGVPMKVKGARGETTLPEQVYRPVIEVLAENDYGPKTVAELAAHFKLRAMPFSQVLQAMFVLIGAGHVHPAQESASESRNHCRALNRYLCERARSGADIQFLASPVTGGGVPVPRFHQLFLLALEHNRKSEAEQSDFAWSLLSAQGQRVVKDGKPLESPEENITELTNMAGDFATQRLPLLKVLEIA
jgi:SAM-dependent methyltransferase